jgi:PAT family beta-lactamase induction signal transducer AmpG
MWPVMVLFNHFRKTNNLFLEASSTFYRLSMLTGNGLIVIIGGYLEQQYGQTKNMVVYHDYRRVIDGYHSIIILQHLELRQVFLQRTNVKAQKRFFSSFSSFFQKTNRFNCFFILLLDLENNYLKCLPF